MKAQFEMEYLRENMMGPNCVRILEELSKDFDLPPGSRVMDLGCGKGLTSIYLAEQFDVQVYATDLWIPATENYHRFLQRGLDGRIVPIHADVHELPYADGFFDAVICIDSYTYYGAEEGFLGRYLSPLVKVGGFIAVATPGLIRDFPDDAVPEEMAPFWEEDMNFHSLDWWKRLWLKEKSVDLTHCKSIQCHRQAWEEWLQCNNPYAIRDIDMMKAEGGKYFNTIELIATVKNAV